MPKHKYFTPFDEFETGLGMPDVVIVASQSMMSAYTSMCICANAPDERTAKVIIAKKYNDGLNVLIDLEGQTVVSTECGVGPTRNLASQVKNYTPMLQCPKCFINVWKFVDYHLLPSLAFFDTFHTDTADRFAQIITDNYQPRIDHEYEEICERNYLAVEQVLDPAQQMAENRAEIEYLIRLKKIEEMEMKKEKKSAEKSLRDI